MGWVITTALVLSALCIADAALFWAAYRLEKRWNTRSH